MAWFVFDQEWKTREVGSMTALMATVCGVRVPLMPRAVA